MINIIYDNYLLPLPVGSCIVLT